MMRAIDREYADHDHPEMERSDAQIRERVVADAYDRAAGVTP